VRLRFRVGDWVTSGARNHGKKKSLDRKTRSVYGSCIARRSRYVNCRNMISQFLM